MNRLAQALEESQEQCRNLMASNNTHELTQLQNCIKLLNEDKDRLLATVQELQVNLILILISFAMLFYFILFHFYPSA